MTFRTPSRIFLSGLALLMILSVLSIGIGVSDHGIWGTFSDPDARQILWEVRVPRTLAALLAGAGLAVSGQAMQILVRNRFIEPMSAGAGQSAALGVLLVTLLVPSAAIWAKMVGASLAALTGSLVLMAILRPLPPTQPLLPALVALVYGGVISAVVSFIAFQGDLAQFLGSWLTGEFSGVLRGRYELLWIAGGASVLMYLIADRLTLLSLGEDAARALGVNVGLITATAVAGLSVVTAMIVVSVGSIPFVGLVVPNLTARLTGDNLRRALPLTALCGALMVLGADILSRLIRFPYEIPVATTVAVIGAVLFLVLINRDPRSRGATGVNPAASADRKGGSHV